MLESRVFNSAAELLCKQFEGPKIWRWSGVQEFFLSTASQYYTRYIDKYSY
jgi:hypothetical protein